MTKTAIRGLACATVLFLTNPAHPWIADHQEFPNGEATVVVHAFCRDSRVMDIGGIRSVHASGTPGYRMLWSAGTTPGQILFFTPALLSRRMTPATLNQDISISSSQAFPKPIPVFRDMAPSSTRSFVQRDSTTQATKGSGGSGFSTTRT